jgi:nicotinamidase-related amidase
MTIYGNEVSLNVNNLHRSVLNMKALILIDLQNGLTKKKRLYQEAIFLDTINSAITTFRDSNSIIVFVQHNNSHLQESTPDWEIDPRFEKHKIDIVIQKEHGNAFHRTILKNILIEFNIKSITIAGLVSHGCVKATCIGGLAEGFEVSLLKNGHTNWNKDARIRIDDTERELTKNGVKLLNVDEDF